MQTRKQNNYFHILINEINQASFRSLSSSSSSSSSKPKILHNKTKNKSKVRCLRLNNSTNGYSSFLNPSINGGKSQLLITFNSKKTNIPRPYQLQLLGLVSHFPYNPGNKSPSCTSTCTSSRQRGSHNIISTSKNPPKISTNLVQKNLKPDLSAQPKVQETSQTQLLQHTCPVHVSNNPHILSTFHCTDSLQSKQPISLRVDIGATCCPRLSGYNLSINGANGILNRLQVLIPNC